MNQLQYRIITNITNIVEVAKVENTKKKVYVSYDFNLTYKKVCSSIFLKN